MRILAVTNVYPTPVMPTYGTFVEQQIKSLEQIGLDIEVMFIDRIQGGMRTYIRLAQKVRARIFESEPDVVHVMYGGVMAYRIIRSIQDRPTVVSFCGSDLLGEHLSGTFRKFIARVGVLASHRAAKQAAGIVVKSKNLYDALPPHIDRSKVRIIPNGVDLERFKPLNRNECRDRLGWDPKYFHVLFPTNSGDPGKRFDLAQAAVEKMRHCGISTEIHQLRGVPHWEVPVWINGSDVLLLTSLHEGSPNVVKEALACDLPVVSVDVGDVRERIQNIEGCYIAVADPSDLADKLSLVYFGRKRIESRNRMQEVSLERIAFELRNLYQELSER
jgi:glycosyltransferase involved in cell wall biosynthesis